MDESGTRNVEIPAEDNVRAISWPLKLRMLSVSTEMAEEALFYARRTRFSDYDCEISIVCSGLKIGLHGFGFTNSKNDLTVRKGS